MRIISAFIIMYYDRNYKSIPLMWLILNYNFWCLIINEPYLLLGNLLFIVSYKLDVPIDALFIWLLCFFALQGYIFVVLPIIVAVILNEDRMMIPIELSLVGIYIYNLFSFFEGKTLQIISYVV